MPTTLNIDERSMENINQFICLINTNYYHKINKDSNIRREQLIDQVLSELVRYLTERKQNVICVYKIYHFFCKTQSIRYNGKTERTVR